MCLVENEDVVAAALTGDAPTTSEWSTILFSTKVRIILETLVFVVCETTPWCYRPILLAVSVAVDEPLASCVVVYI